MTSTHARTAGVLIFFLVVASVVFLAHGALFQIGLNAFEDISYRLDPTADRAYRYGERHFNSSNPEAYDVNRAEYFFKAAAAKDPTLLYVQHELARISFLRSNFSQALAQINFQISMHGDATPNSYYIRGLIEGYMGEYAASAKDYEHFLQFDPRDWAALNDYAWVLLKAERFSDAADATARGLADFPDNPWLLNSRATALYELKQYSEAFAAAQKASAAVTNLPETQWLHAYPGNDPKIGEEGLAAFKKAVADNMHTIQLALASSTLQ